MPVNSGEMWVHIFLIKRYCITKCFKFMTLNPNAIIYCVDLYICPTSMFLEVGAENFACLQPGFTFRSFVLYPKAYFCVLCGSRANSFYFSVHLLIGTYNGDWVYLLSSTKWMFKIEVNFQNKSAKVLSCIPYETSQCYKYWILPAGYIYIYMSLL
jgi:hypothetical protein